MSVIFIVSCYYLVGYFSEIVGDKLEEGGDDVKLLCFLWFGLYMCYNGKYNELLDCEVM